MKTFLKYIAVIGFLILLIIGGISYYIYATINEEAPINDSIILTIKPNSNVESIVELFNKQGIFQPKWLFINYIKVHIKLNDNAIFYAGTYKFDKNQKNSDIINAIFSGSSKYYIRLMIPEGLNIKEIANRAERILAIDVNEFIRLANSDEIIREYGIKAKSLEGYLMPDTYLVAPTIDAQALLKLMLDSQMELWNSRFAELARQKSMEMHQVLTLASIIEAESPVVDERKRVSGVYHNRLKKGWKLEADPTVQYAIGEKRRLLFRDLEFDSPYNTYKYFGLPPGPINSPAASAIEAALIPEAHDYMFFVAVGDGSGRHNFSKNYNQHLNYAREFRRNVGRSR